MTIETVIDALHGGPEADLGPLMEAILKIGQLPALGSKYLYH